MAFRLLGARLSLAGTRSRLCARATDLNLGGTVSAMETTPDAHAIVLVEAASDQLALEALSTRRGHNLNARGISIVAIGGATNIGSFLKRYGPQGLGLRLARLCDATEEGDFQRGLERAGLGANLTRTGMERLGFYVR